MHSDAPPTPVSPASIAAGHESSHVGLRGFIVFVVILVGFGLIVHVTIWGLMVGFAKLDSLGDPMISPVQDKKPTPPAPWLQPSPPQGVEPRDDWQDLAQLREREKTTLTTYGRDEATGGMRIPIDRAMQLVVEKKLTGPHSSAAPVMPSKASDSDTSGGR